MIRKITAPLATAFTILSLSAAAHAQFIPAPQLQFPATTFHPIPYQPVPYAPSITPLQPLPSTPSYTQPYVDTPSLPPLPYYLPAPAFNHN